jgi:hypothetical protein
MTCVGALGVGAVAVSTYFLVQAVKLHNLYNQCCSSTGQGNTASPCPDPTFVDRASFCDSTHGDFYFDAKLGCSLLAAGFVLICVAGVGCCLKSCCKRERMNEEDSVLLEIGKKRAAAKPAEKPAAPRKSFLRP